MKTQIYTPSEMELAAIGPRDQKKPGSVEWSWHTLDILIRKWRRYETTWQEWETTLSEAEEYAIWDVIPPGQPYGSLETMLEETLHVAASSIGVRTLFDNRTIMEAAHPADLGPHGGDHKSETFQDSVNQAYNCNVDFGNKATYLTSRIARDRPDILDRMKAGEFRSVRQAAIEAGIVKDIKYIQVPPDPVKIAEKLKERLTPKQLRELVNLLTS